MSDEMKELRKELYFAVGNFMHGFVANLFEGKQDVAKSAKSGAFALVQFGCRAKLMTPDEGNDMLGLLRNKGLNSAEVFEKHGHADACAASLVATFTGS